MFPQRSLSLGPVLQVARQLAVAIGFTQYAPRQKGHMSPAELLSRLQEIWGTAALNRWFDHAGPYRRVAIGMASLSLPSLAQAAFLAAQSGHEVVAVAQLAMSVALMWSARDVVRTGALGRLRGFPHPSLVVLTATVIASRSLHSDIGGIEAASPILLAGAVMLSVAALVECSTHGHQDRLRLLICRALMIIGATMVGVDWLVLAGSGLNDELFYSLAIGTMGVIMLIVAFSEYRLVSRAVRLMVRQPA